MSRREADTESRLLTTNYESEKKEFLGLQIFSKTFIPLLVPTVVFSELFL